MGTQQGTVRAVLSGAYDMQLQGRLRTQLLAVPCNPQVQKTEGSMCALEMATCARAGVRLQPHANWRVLPGALTQEHGGGHRPRLLEQLLLAIKAHALELIHW